MTTRKPTSPLSKGTLLYSQSSGEIYELDGGFVRLGVGYSGRRQWTNQPSSDGLVGTGPIPRGRWKTSKAFTHDRLGPVCIPLAPASYLTDAKGRSGFYIHGDNSHGDRSASSGCIILGRGLRERIAALGQVDLYVIE